MLSWFFILIGLAGVLHAIMLVRALIRASSKSDRADAQSDAIFALTVAGAAFGVAYITQHWL